MKKSILLLFIIIIIAVPVIILVSQYFPYDTVESNRLQAAGVVCASIVSCIALVYAIMEYSQHKNASETTLICQYMHRYATDVNVQKIKQYILEKGLKDENGYIVGFDEKAETSYEPTVLEKEQFMMVFEELQQCIDAKMIPLRKAIELFGYYVSVFHRIEKFHLGITDYDNEKFWRYYLKFANSIDKDFHLKDPD